MGSPLKHLLYDVENRTSDKFISAEELANNLKKLDKCGRVEMKKETKIDRISNLPWNALDNILVHLPLRDAVRTSILSSKWRYKWIGISQYVFDDKCFPGPLSDTGARWGEIMKIIHQVQSNHSGRIDKFKLAAFCSPNYSDLDQWITFLTEKGIKELIIKEFRFFKRFKLPSCLFSYPQLSCLELYGCIFKLPSTFQGFNCLKSIELTQVSIIGDSLESLICGCPVLERLILLNIDHLAILRIQNQNLKYLKIDSDFEDICLRNSPLLVSVDIHLIHPLYGRGRPRLLEQGEPCNLVRVIGCLYGVRKLTLSGHFLQFLANQNIPERFPIMLNNLSSLDLMEVRFNSLKDIAAIFAILRSSPNLKDLVITVQQLTEASRHCSVELKKDQFLCDFNRLKVVKFRGICCTRAEWDFLVIVLTHSPVLERMTIIRYGGERIPESLLQRIERASEHVKFISLTS